MEINKTNTASLELAKLDWQNEFGYIDWKIDIQFVDFDNDATARIDLDTINYEKKETTIFIDEDYVEMKDIEDVLWLVYHELEHIKHEECRLLFKGEIEMYREQLDYLRELSFEKVISRAASVNAERYLDDIKQ